MVTKWTSELFEVECRKLADSLGHFPTNTELKRMGRCDVASQIGKRGGYKSVARRLGLPRIHSDSDTGWEGEQQVAYEMMACNSELLNVESPEEADAYLCASASWSMREFGLDADIAIDGACKHVASYMQTITSMNRHLGTGIEARACMVRANRAMAIFEQASKWTLEKRPTLTINR